ncbi:OmpA family protein [Phaeobacter inhibens]|uniref:OmpA family protein n=1 Tax=Phaeobacter inhibens TaxID=221822 RepID=UPI0024905B0B|nr:OmpA family protein [Phaeobacter inhibens]
MRLSSLLISGLTFVAAAALSLVVAGFAVTGIEAGSETAVRRALDKVGYTWAEVTADGLRVILNGTAPDEATRFGVISLVGGVVDAARVIDEMRITPSEGIAPPRFSAEILRNDSGISIIGLIPRVTDRETVITRLNTIAGADQVADLLETANYTAPRGWMAAMDYALDALSLLPRSKISVEAEEVSITAISDSVDAKEQIEKRLTRMAPAGLRLSLDIAAPRPVITPFTLRYSLDDAGGRFDACSAESELSRDRILRAATKAGFDGKADCVIGMGVPSPNWARAAELGIASLSELGGGSVTLANADMTLVAAEGTAPALFDHVVGELESALPQVFALHAVLPEPETEDGNGPSEFTATLSPEGQVQLRGRISDEALRQISSSYAQARFGSQNVYSATRVVEDLPADWPVRVLAGLEALSHLQRGAVSVTPDSLSLSGMSHREDAPSEIAKLLSAKLGDAESYELNVTYEAPPEPADKPMSPELCEAELAAVQTVSKITFEPGSATVAAGSRDTLDQIADILARCDGVRLEIQGHTDSQGREEMNQTLSQSRAQSVLNELRGRRLVTSSFTAKGYGESTPIASNDTEDGREANRRIEFRLIRPANDAASETTLDEAATASEGTSETPSDSEQETSGQ